jgi:hypothetical protein
MPRFGDEIVCTGPNGSLVKARMDHEIAFVVVGGQAVSWDCPQRDPDALDRLLQPTTLDSYRVIAAPHSLRLEVRARSDNSFAKLGVHTPLKQVHSADLPTPLRDGPSLEEVGRDSIAGKLNGVPARIGSPRDLIPLAHPASSVDAARAERLTRDVESLALCIESVACTDPSVHRTPQT